ncbi:MAG: ankyrin repeat domain-containing protein, partial [Parvularculales bacterium]
TPLHVAALASKTPGVVEVLLDRGADGAARDKVEKIPFDYARDNESLRDTPVYWRLNEAQYR